MGCPLVESCGVVGAVIPLRERDTDDRCQYKGNKWSTKKGDLSHTNRGESMQESKPQRQDADQEGTYGPVYGLEEYVMHECRGCGLMIKGLLPYCMKCGRELNKKGLCAKCGVNERKPKSRNGMQSRYCEACQGEQISIVLNAAAELERNRMAKKHRTQDHKENLYETRRGG